MVTVKSRARMKVLVVDDDEGCRNVVRLLLELSGYGVQGAENGQSAWNLLKAGSISYDLVITDVNMPGMDGLQLLQKIREHGLAVTTILMTGCRRDEVVTRARSLGVVNVLAKPFGAADLQRMVKSALAKSRAGKERVTNEV